MSSCVTLTFLPHSSSLRGFPCCQLITRMCRFLRQDRRQREQSKGCDRRRLLTPCFWNDPDDARRTVWFSLLINVVYSWSRHFCIPWNEEKKIHIAILSTQFYYIKCKYYHFTLCWIFFLNWYFILCFWLRGCQSQKGQSSQVRQEERKRKGARLWLKTE